MNKKYKAMPIYGKNNKVVWISEKLFKDIQKCSDIQSVEVETEIETYYDELKARRCFLENEKYEPNRIEHNKVKIIYRTEHSCGTFILNGLKQHQIK